MQERRQRLGSFHATHEIRHYVLVGTRDQDPRTPVVAKLFSPTDIDFANEHYVGHQLRFDTQAQEHITVMQDNEKIDPDLVLGYYPYIKGDRLEDAFLIKERQDQIQFKSSLWPIVAITAFILQIGKSIEILHELEIAHGDLHDGNIMQPAEDHFTIIDFGGAHIEAGCSSVEVQNDHNSFARHISRMLLSGLKYIPRGSYGYVEFAHHHHLEDVRDQYGKRAAISLEALMNADSPRIDRHIQNLIDDVV